MTKYPPTLRRYFSPLTLICSFQLFACAVSKPGFSQGMAWLVPYIICRSELILVYAGARAHANKVSFYQIWNRLLILAVKPAAARDHSLSQRLPLLCISGIHPVSYQHHVVPYSTSALLVQQPEASRVNENPACLNGKPALLKYKRSVLQSSK